MDLTKVQMEKINGFIKDGMRLLESERTITDFDTGDQDAEKLINNLEKYPHLFTLGCVMDRQIKAGRAWIIPYKVGKILGSFDFSYYEKATLTDFRRIFSQNKLHRFNKKQAEYFYSAVQLIQNNYKGNALRIWRDNPSSAAIIRRFLEFDGVGVKIATMAANILARDFKVPMRDHASLDISPDSRVRNFFVSQKLVRPEASNEEIIYRARELNPTYPGALDFPAWSHERA